MKRLKKRPKEIYLMSLIGNIQSWHEENHEIISSAKCLSKINHGFLFEYPAME